MNKIFSERRNVTKGFDPYLHLFIVIKIDFKMTLNVFFFLNIQIMQRKQNATK